MNDDVARLGKRLERERAARKEAERLLEEKSRELYESNCSLKSLAATLEQQVAARTAELHVALDDAKNKNVQLREAQLALEQQLNAVNQHTIASIADRAGNIIYANDKFVEISGYPREELIGFNHRLVNSGHHPREFFSTLWQTIAMGKVWSGEIRNRRKDGTYYWVNATIVPFLDDSGKPYQYFSMRTDITPLKQAEASLKQLVFDLGERVKEWACLNAVIQALQDVAHSDVEILQAAVQQIPSGWLEPSDTVARIRLGEVEVATAGFANTEWHQRSDIPAQESEAFVEVCRLQGIGCEDNPLFLAQEQDLLDNIARQIGLVMGQRRAQREVVAARDAAEAANRAKSDFLANMSHEIRTPMNGIIGMSELAIDSTSDDERREYMQIVKTSAQALLGIINDILDFSKIEAGKLLVEHVSFDLQETVTESLRTFSLRASEKGLLIGCDFAADVPPRVIGDPTRLRQVLLNLIGNALKFTEHGKIIVKLSLLAEHDHVASVRFSVRDTGIGIPQEKLATIFDAFTQADTSTTRQYGGTGLGLTITLCLVELMGGRMEVDSDVGKGSTFHFILPLGVDSHDKTTQNDGPTNEDASSRGIDTASDISLAVLLVEDHPINQQLATRLLEKWGHRVTLAQNGLEAVNRMSAGQPFDMILMDMQMPVMGGIESTQRIRALETERGLPRLPIVAMTANAMQGDRERCLDAGMDDYLAKPISQTDLFNKLRIYAPVRSAVPVTQQSLRPTGAARSPESIATAGSFDYRAALQAMDAEIIEILTPTFRTHYPGELAALRRALADHDGEEAMRRAHGMKGTLAAFGAQPAERLAARIEAIVKTGELDSVPGMLDELEMQINHLVAALN